MAILHTDFKWQFGVLWGAGRPPDPLQSPGGCAPRTPCRARGASPPGPPSGEGRGKIHENYFLRTKLQWPYSQSMRDVLHNGGVERSGNALGGCFRSVEKFGGEAKNKV